MLEKRRPAGDELPAESLNESTDLDSLLSAILGDRADDTRPATLALLLDDPDRPNVRTMERLSAEGHSQPIREEWRTNIYSRVGARHGRSRTLLPLIGAVAVLILLGVLGLRQFNGPVPAADTTGAGITAVPAPAAATVPPPSPPTEVAGPPAIDASALAATTAVQPAPQAPRRVDDSPRPAVSDGPRNSIRPSNLTSARTPTVTVGERLDTFASRSTPPPATSTVGSTAEPPTPVASSPPAATTGPPAPDAPTSQPAATRGDRV